MLKVRCFNCNHQICLYQKDGPGPLKRLYEDRILIPKIVWKQNKKILCNKCRRWLGVAHIYLKESRRCFILFEGEICKKVVKL